MPKAAFEESFQGKRVVVTGAGRGIGKALVARLNEYGAIVYAISINPDNLASLQKEHPKIKVIQVNLEDWDETREAAEKIGPVDILINNAGVISFETFLNIRPETVDKVFNTNFKAVINLSQVIAGEMIRNGRVGSIVNVSSMGAKRPIPSVAVYSASKAALDNLTRGMALELGPFHIRVNSLNVGAVATDMGNSGLVEVSKTMASAGLDPAEVEKIVMSRFPRGNMFLDMDEVVNSILFVASDSVPNLHGHGLVVDGGWTCA